MTNPFAEIVGSALGDAEEVGGAFDCQECFKTVNEALYFDEKSLLVWVCPDGHKSHIEGFHID